MEDNKYKIKFRNLEMNLEETKDYLSKMKSGAINIELTEEERKEYLNHEEGKKRDNELCKKRTGDEGGIWKLLNEKEYLISRLEGDIKSVELVIPGNKNLKTTPRRPPWYYFKKY